MATYHNLLQTKLGTNTFNVNIAGGADRVMRTQARAFQGNRKAGLRGCSAAIGIQIDRMRILGFTRLPIGGQVWQHKILKLLLTEGKNAGPKDGTVTLGELRA